jgi:hypothetical protein
MADPKSYRWHWYDNSHTDTSVTYTPATHPNGYWKQYAYADADPDAERDADSCDPDAIHPRPQDSVSQHRQAIV